MGYFPVRYDSRVIIYDRTGFIRLTGGCNRILANAKLGSIFQCVKFEDKMCGTKMRKIFPQEDADFLMQEPEPDICSE